MTSPDIPRFSEPQRDDSGRFLPGQGGRKPGSRNKIPRETMLQLQQMRGIAVDKLRSLIDAGDIRAITYVLNRVVGKSRAIEMDDTRPATIAEMLASGEIAPDEAASIASAIKSLREIEDIEQLRAKLIELEAIVTDGAQR